MKPEWSLPCSQQPSTGPYPEPDQSIPILGCTINIQYAIWHENKLQPSDTEIRCA
jgi:hypothetical protein